jgi:hypothetical protein
MFCSPLHQKDTEQAAWPTSALLFSMLGSVKPSRFREAAARGRLYDVCGTARYCANVRADATARGWSRDADVSIPRDREGFEIPIGTTVCCCRPIVTLAVSRSLSFGSLNTLRVAIWLHGTGQLGAEERT